MSLHAMRWAMELPIKPASLKWLFVALANDERNNGVCWPSLDRLMQITQLDRKTIIAGLDRLEAPPPAGFGLLADSGFRKGRTGQVKVYRFIGLPSMPKLGLLKDAELGQQEFRFSQERVPKTEPVTYKGTDDEPAVAAPAGKKISPAAAANLYFSPKLSSQDCTAAALYLMNHPQAQLVLDELAGILQKKAIGNPLGLLKSLAEQAKRGQLLPSHAPRIEAERELEQVQAELKKAQQAGRHQ